MAFLSSRYRMEIFGLPGVVYDIQADERRCFILENQISQYLELVGGGIVRGLNVYKEPSTNFDVVIDEGIAIVPFSATKTIIVPGQEPQIKTEVYYVAIRSDEKTTVEVDPGSVTGLYLTAPSNAAGDGTSYHFEVVANLIRNCTTDTSSSDAYRLYTVEGEIKGQTNLSVFVNNKKQFGNYTIVGGNSILFKGKRLPSDTVTVRIEPQNSVILGIIVASNTGIVSVDTSVRSTVKDRFKEEFIATALKSHTHNGGSGNASQIVLTTSTNYVAATPVNVERTLYKVKKAKASADDTEKALIDNTAMTDEWKAFSGVSNFVDGNILVDTTAQFEPVGHVDGCKGYYLNPNVENQDKYLNVISSSSTHVVVDDDIAAYGKFGQRYLLIPYMVQVAVNGKEEYYGYTVVSDDNSYITIKFNGSLEPEDEVSVKLFYTNKQHEVRGIIEIESEPSRGSSSRSINFGGQNFTTGTIATDRIPTLDHLGRVKEAMIPDVSNASNFEAGWVWNSDTLDCITYRPRAQQIASVRDVLWIEKDPTDNTFYACANNTILRAKKSRIYDTQEWVYDGYHDVYKPFKIIKQPNTISGGTNLYAFNDRYVLVKVKENGTEYWDEFVNLLEDRNKLNLGRHPKITEIQGVDTIYDLCADASGRLFMGTNVGLFMLDPVRSSRIWYKLISSATFAVTSVHVIDDEDNYALLISGGNGVNYIYRSSFEPLRITERADKTSIIRLTSTANLAAGERIIISDLNGEPENVLITSVDSATQITVSPALNGNYNPFSAIVFKNFEPFDNMDGVEVKTRGISTNANGDVIAISDNNGAGNAIYELYLEDVVSGDFQASGIAAPSGTEILFAKELFGYFEDEIYVPGSYYVCAEGVSDSDSGVYRYTGSWLKLTNTTFDTSINESLKESNFLFQTDADEFYVGTKDGIYQSSMNSDTAKKLAVRNSAIFFGRPLNVENNVFKSKLTDGYIGFVNDDNETLIASGERTIYVTADLKNVQAGDYLRFTVKGGGPRVGFYFRILTITAVVSAKKQYEIEIDAFDGTYLDTSTVSYGETFEIVPMLPPVPIINGTPQLDAYTSNKNPFTYDYGTQSVTFEKLNQRSDDIFIATQFQQFTPKRGNWPVKTENTATDYRVFLNGRDITQISDTLLNVVRLKNLQPSGSEITNTRLVAKNTLFRGLNLKSQKVQISVKSGTSTINLEYSIIDNDESSVTISGDRYNAITVNGTVVPGNITFTVKLAKALPENSTNDYTSIQLASPVTANDLVNITIKGSYIVGAGKYSHEQIEDHLSELETGYPYALDSVRNTDFLQLYGAVRNFIISMSDDTSRIVYHRYSEPDIIDLINSNIPVSTVAESNEDPGKISYNVFGIYYSENYGGMFALTEQGVFFRADQSETNTNPKWNQLTDFLDTMSPLGILEPDSDNPSGVFIGFDEDTKTWKVSWGGFHNSEVKNNGLSNITVVAVQIDQDDVNTFYLGTENHGVLKGEKQDDNSYKFRSIYNYTSFSDVENGKVRDLLVDESKNSVIHLVTETGLYRSSDKGENFELLVLHKLQSSGLDAQNKFDNDLKKCNCVKVYKGTQLNDFDIYFGGDALYVRTSTQDITYDNKLEFTKYAVSDITYENVYDFQINDIALDQTNKNVIWLATSNGPYYTKTGIGSPLEYYVKEEPEQEFDEDTKQIYSYITVWGTIAASDLPAGNFILGNKFRTDKVFEVVSLTYPAAGVTKIKVLGRAINNGDKIVRVNEPIAIKRWIRVSEGLRDVYCNTIALNGSDVWLGTDSDGIYKLSGPAEWTQNSSGLGSFTEESKVSISQIEFFNGVAYAGLRDVGGYQGGLFYYDTDTEEWTRIAGRYAGSIGDNNITDGLDKHDVLSFSVRESDTDFIVIGTSDGAYYSTNGGDSWTRLNVPTDSILSLDLIQSRYGALLAGTEGAGVYQGTTYGKNWKQQMSKVSMLDEIRSRFWRILDIYEDKSDTSEPLRVSVHPSKKNINEFTNRDHLVDYKKVSNESTGDFEWEAIGNNWSYPGQTLWLDPANYPFMAKLGLNSNVGNANKGYGFTANSVIRDKRAIDRLILTLNDHQVWKNGYKSFYDDTLNRQGGAMLMDGSMGQFFQGSSATPTRSGRINSPRNFAIRDIIINPNNTSNLELYAATENAGVLKVEMNDAFNTFPRYSSGYLHLSHDPDAAPGDRISFRCRLVYGWPDGRRFYPNHWDTNEVKVGDYMILLLQNDFGPKYKAQVTDVSHAADADPYIKIDIIEDTSENPGIGDLTLTDFWFYACSNVCIDNINGQDDFNYVAGLSYIMDSAIDNPVFESGEIYDIVTLNVNTSDITSEDYVDVSNFVDAKFIFAPYLGVLENGFYSANVPFIVKEATLIEPNQIEVKLKTHNLEFASGSTTSYVEDIYWIPGEGRTAIRLRDEFPEQNNYHLLYTLRIQPNHNVEAVYRIQEVYYWDRRLLYVTDTTGSVYNTITVNGTQRNGVNARINFGITFLKGTAHPNWFPSISQIPFITKKATVTRLDGGLSDYESDYNDQLGNPEYKLCFNKLLAPTGDPGSVLYAATQPGGLMKYESGSWQKVTSLPENFVLDIDAVEGVVLSDTDAQLYAMTRSKVYRSTGTPSSFDDTNWIDITPAGLQSQKFTAIRGFQGGCYLATENDGILVTTDLGENWTQSNDGIDVVTCPLWKFASDPTDASNVYAYGFKAGVFKREMDGSDSLFIPRGRGLKNRNVSDLSVCGETLYAATSTGGIYKSVDAGESWTHLECDEFKSKIIKNVSAFPDNPDIVMAITQKDILSLGMVGASDVEMPGTTNSIWRSKNGGKTWTKISDYVVDRNIEYYAPYSTELSCFADGTCYIGVRKYNSTLNSVAGTIWRSADFGETFTEIIAGVGITNISCITKTVNKSNEVFILLTEHNKTVIYMSFDNGLTWKRRERPYSLMYLSAYADPSTLYSMSNKTVTTDSAPTPITGTVSWLDTYSAYKYIQPAQFFDSYLNTNLHYGDFEGAKLQITTDASGTIVDITEQLNHYEYNTVIPASNPDASLADLSVQSGSTFAITNISRIEISSPDEAFKTAAQGLFVGLYIQINSQTPKRIASYINDTANDKLVLYVIGAMDDDLTAESANISIGHYNGTELEPVTNLFINTDLGWGAFGLAISINYFGKSEYYSGDLRMREAPDSAPYTITTNAFKGGWLGSDDKYYIIRDKNFYSFSENDVLYDALVIESALHSTLLNSNILYGGVVRTSTQGYITTDSGIYYSTTPEDNDGWTLISNQKYRTLDGETTTFTTINRPLYLFAGNSNSAYLIVDNNKLLSTTSLTSTISNPSTAYWSEKTLGPFAATPGFNIIAVKSLKIHPSEFGTLLLGYSEANSTNSGLYVSKDGANSWFKLYLDSSNQSIGVTATEFVDSANSKILIGAVQGTNCTLYTNTLSTYGNKVLSVAKIGTKGVLSGTDKGLSYINKADSKGSYFFNSGQSQNNGFVSIKHNATHVFTCESNKLFVFNKSSLISSNSLEMALNSTIELNGNVTINNIVLTPTTVYLCTNSGLLSSEISETVAGTASFATVPGTINKSITDVVFDEDGKTWIATQGDGLIGIDTNGEELQFSPSNSVIPSKVNSIAYIPTTFVSLSADGANLGIPASTKQDEILIVKTYNRDMIDTIVDGQTYESAVYGTILSSFWDAATQTSTLTLSAETATLNGRVLIVDGNHATPFNIVSSSGNNVVVSGFVSNETHKFAAYLKAQTADYVVYSGPVQSQIEDLSVKTAENYRYFIYYKDSSGRYYPAFYFSVVYNGGRTQVYQIKRILIGTDQGAYSYDLYSFQISNLVNKTGVTRIKLDERYNAIITHDSGVLRFNYIQQTTFPLSTQQYYDIDVEDRTVLIGSASGVFTVEGKENKGTLGEIIVDFKSPSSSLFKLWSFESGGEATNIVYKASENKVYIALKNAVYVSREGIFGYTLISGNVNENETIHSLNYGADDTTALMISDKNVYMAPSTLTPKTFMRVLLGNGSNAYIIGAPAVQHFDGETLLVSINNPSALTNANNQFLSFTLNGPDVYRNYLYETAPSYESGLHTGGLWANSRSGIVYDTLTDIEIDNNGRLWTCGVNSIFMNDPNHPTLGWQKVPLANLKISVWGEEYIIPLSIRATNYTYGNGVLVTAQVVRPNFDFELTRGGENFGKRILTINKNSTVIIYIMAEYDSTTDSYVFRATNVSNGYFEEKDPHFTAKSIYNQLFYDYQKSPVSFRGVAIDLPSINQGGATISGVRGTLTVLAGNDFCELERFIGCAELSIGNGRRTNDIGTRIGYQTASENVYDMPHNFVRRNYSNIKDSLENYRPYRGSAAAIDPNDSDIIYLAVFNPGENTPLSTQAKNSDASELLKSVDGGYSWCAVNIYGDLPSNARINSICIDPTNSNVVYVGVTGNSNIQNGVYMSEDGGVTFTNISSGLPKYPVSVVYLSDNAITGGTLYAGLIGRGLYSRKPSVYGYGYGIGYNTYGYDYGYEIEGYDYFDVFGITTPVIGNWVEEKARFTQVDGLALTRSVVNDIDVSDDNNKLIYIATEENGVQKSIDSGNVWSFDVNGLPSNLSCTVIKVSPYDDNLVWLGTSKGFYVKNKRSNTWRLNSYIPETETVKFIGLNRSLSKNVIAFTYKIPVDPSTIDGILILRKEEAPIGYSPTSTLHIVGKTAGDALVIYSDSPTDDNGYVTFRDESNIRLGVEYFYDFYTYVVNPTTGLPTYTKFPDLYENELWKFDRITGELEIRLMEGEVESASYSEITGLTTLNNPGRIKDVDTNGFNKHLIGKIINFSNGYSTTVENVSDTAIVISGDHEDLSGVTYNIETGMIEHEFEGYVLNPNIDQKNHVEADGKEVTFSIRDNTDSTISIRLIPQRPSLSDVAGLHEPVIGNFNDRISNTLRVSSSKQLTSSFVHLLYVLTDKAIYVSEDNGDTFTRLTPVDAEFNYIEFEKQDGLKNHESVRGWIATSTGLYYTNTGFQSIVEELSQVGGVYNFVKLDEKNNRIIYAFKTGTGLLRSVNGGKSFDHIQTDLDSLNINQMDFATDFVNNFLASTEDEGFIHVKDSVRDTFDINIETDVKFDVVTPSKFKIGDTIEGDANSIHIHSKSKANSLNDQVNTVEFKVSKGNYVKFDINYQESKADTSIVHVGKSGTHPTGVPFRLRIPGTIDEYIVGFSLDQLPDNTLVAGTNRGGFLSKDGKTWEKIDNFLIPDSVYAITRLKDGYTYLGTDNGAWINTKIDDNVNFKPKYKIGQKIRTFWSYKNGPKSVTFMGGEDGLIIKYRNYPYILVTTPANFDSSEGIRFAWGEERPDGKVNPGGLDDKLLDYLNQERYFVNWTTGRTEKSTGWAGTLVVRYEGTEPSGFFPSNQLNYEKGDRRYIDAVRLPYLDVTADGEIDISKTYAYFPYGLTIADNVRCVNDREVDGVTRDMIRTNPSLGDTPDTFTLEEPFIDKLDISNISPIDGDRSNNNPINGEFNGGPDSEGAPLKANTTYIYELWSYFERPPNFVFQSGYDKVRMYSKVNIKEYTIHIPINQMPTAKIVTCGDAVSDYHYVVGTDDGVFYATQNQGITKSSGTDNHNINAILASEFEIGTIYAASNNGILISTDGGATFEKILVIEDYNIRNVFSLTEDGNGIVYAGTDRGVFRKDPLDNTKWYFDSIVGAGTLAPKGREIGQSFTIE